MAMARVLLAALFAVALAQESADMAARLNDKAGTLTCETCGHVHDLAKDGELPESCPKCGAPKSAFKATAVEAEAEAPVSDEEKGQQFVDSATELQDKLAQLKALLAAKGEGADPDLKKSLESLEKQLTGLGLSMDGGAQEPGQNQELTQFLGACVTMTMKTGVSGGVSHLKKLAAAVPKVEAAAKLEFYQLLATCINELTDQELNEHRAGKLPKLPEVHVKAAAEKGPQQVIDLQATLWPELKLIAEALISQIDVDAPNVLPGLVAAIPFIGVIGFLIKKFADMQTRDEEKKDKKTKKKN